METKTFEVHPFHVERRNGLFRPTEHSVHVPDPFEVDVTTGDLVNADPFLMSGTVKKDRPGVLLGFAWPGKTEIALGFHVWVSNPQKDISGMIPVFLMQDENTIGALQTRVI